MNPSIGALRHRVLLEAAVDSPDELGGFTRSFTPLARLWAKMESLGADAQFTEQRAEHSRRHAVTIRWRPDVENGMRFDFRGRKLEIRSLEDSSETRRFLRCLCEEFS